MNAELTREAPIVRRRKHRAPQPSVSRILIAAAMPNHRTLHHMLKRKSPAYQIRSLVYMAGKLLWHASHQI